MENGTNDEMEGKSLLAEHVALFLAGKRGKLKLALKEVFYPSDIHDMYDEALTAERVARKDRYGPMLRRWEAADAAREAGTISEPDRKAVREQHHQEMDVLENEVLPIAWTRFERDALNSAYGGSDLDAVPPEIRKAFLAVFSDAVDDLIEGCYGLHPEADGPYD